MDAYEPFVSLGVALAMGLIIGLEREQASSTEPDTVRAIGGARTFPLFALTGAVAALIARQIGLWFIGLPLAALIVFTAIAYKDDVDKGRDRGLTSEAAFVLTYLLGALALSSGIFESRGHRLTVVAAIGVSAATLLSLKPTLHGLARNISRDDVYATLKFLIVAVVVLPLLPDRTYGPLDVLNPLHIGTMIVLIAGLAFVGYVAVRALGAGRGLGLTGLIGGFVSSTAVTLSMADRAKREPAVQDACALAVVLACTIMPGRVLAAISIVHAPLVASVAWPPGAMIAGGAAVSLAYYLKSRTKKATAEAMPVKNPFELSSAVKFGVLFAIVLFVSKAATQYLGNQGTFIAALLAGTTDVDAISLSMADLAKHGLSTQVAATAILLATASNTVVKCALAFISGGATFGRRVAIGLGASLVTGAVGLAILWL